MNIYEATNWGVEVQGPGNVLAAKDFEEACEKANEINNALIHVKNSGHIDEFFQCEED